MLITDKVRLKEFGSNHRVWQGIPGVVRTKNGRIFVSFYSGDVKETYGNFAVVLKSDGEGFGEPIAAAFKEGKFRCFDPVLWIDPLDRLWFIWNVMPGEQVMAAVCDDPDADELVFGEEFQIGRGIMMNKPTVLTSGEWIFPIAVWKFELMKAVREPALREDDETGAFVYKSSDNGQSFVKLGGMQMRDRSFDEHMILELENGALAMFVRTNYGIGVSYSYDRGRNWSKGQDSKLGGPCSRFFISRLSSGRILLINHHEFKGRNNLTAMLSEDDGKSFPYKLLVDGRNEVSYPDAMECDDGYIYMIHDRERGCFKRSLDEVYACAREILVSKFSEQDIINGAIGEESYLCRVVSKLDKLADGSPDPFEQSVADDREFAELILKEKTADVMGRVFERYPMNCVGVEGFDFEKLDAMIKKFDESGKSDASLLCDIITHVRTAPKKGGAYPIIRMVKNYVENSFNDEFSVSAMAKRLNISVYYLTHLFKKATGTTVVEYRNELRLTVGKKLLINTDDSIGEIAQKIGFCSSAYFSEVFLKSEKISPTEYRKFHKLPYTKIDG